MSDIADCFTEHNETQYVHNRSNVNAQAYPFFVVVGALLMFFVSSMFFVPGTAAAANAEIVGDPPPVFIPPLGPEEIDDEISQPPLNPQLIEYEVQSGDTVWDIASKFGTDPESLAVINDLGNWHRLQPGDEMRVLTISGLLYEVSPGDTVEEIAQEHGLDSDDLKAANNLRPGDEVSVGQELVLPYARPASEAVMAARGELFRWPVRGRISSPFGYRWGRFHSGIDIAASQGTPIEASRGGRVTFAGWRGSYGKLVIIDHGDDKTTWYAHMSRIAVEENQMVDRGQVIGYVGTTGRSTGPHLHFEIRENDDPQNPMDYLPD